ncbi:hypothetical protein F4778DRAFT_415610 [Xylariomycetidae sp. FL2044]|nr:hypothetical protein F4778DRAFT_415610 [Xylariomycetidae sp. FL2044]
MQNHSCIAYALVFTTLSHVPRRLLAISIHHGAGPIHHSYTSHPNSSPQSSMNKGPSGDEREDNQIWLLVGISVYSELWESSITTTHMPNHAGGYCPEYKESSYSKIVACGKNGEQKVAGFRCAVSLTRWKLSGSNQFRRMRHRGISSLLENN